MHHRLLLLLFLLLASPVAAVRAQEIVWARQSEDVAYLEGVVTLQIELDSEQNVYVLYSLQNRVKFESVAFQSSGPTDILLIKYDPQGHIEWSRQMGGSDWDLGSDIALDQDDNLLITGTLPLGGTFLGETLDISNGGAFFAKIAPDGDLLWVRQYGDQNGQGHSITADKFNNVITAGSMGVKKDRVVAKYTSNGALIWSRQMVYENCCVSPSIQDIKTGANGEIVFTGDFTGNITFGGRRLKATNFYSAYIFKLDVNGNVIWSNQVDAGGSSLNDARSTEIELDQSGDIYMTGYFNDIAKLGSITLSELNDIDDRTGFLTRLTASGTFIWATAMYGRDMMPVSLEINPDTHDLHVSGSSFQWFIYDDDYVSSVIGNQSFIVTTNSNGDFKNCMFLNDEASPTYATSIAYAAENEFYVGGNFFPDFNLGCFELEGGSWYTSYLFKSGKIPEIAVSDLEAVCVGNTATFEALDGEEATSFKWHFPTGVESTTGSFETVGPAITVQVNEYHERAHVTVVPYFECYPRTEFSGTFSIAQKPARPQKPSGETVVCSGAQAAYTTASVDGALHYTWRLSSNLQAIEQSDTEIKVMISAAHPTATLDVKAENGCGESALSEPLTLTVDPIPSIPVIKGPAEVCAGQTEVQYTASATGVNKFGWIIPSSLNFKNTVPDSSIVKLGFPQGTSEVVVQAVSKGLCKNSVSAPFAVAITQPPLTPTAIEGQTQLCVNDQAVTYVALPAQEQVDLTWSFPGGFSAESSVNNQVVLNLAANAQSGQISVAMSNHCFTTIKKTLDIVVSRAPDKPMIKKDQCDIKLWYEGGDKIGWFKDGFQLFGDQPAIALAAADSGYYRIEASNVCGKTMSDEIYVVPVIPGDVFIPNVVTADGDNRNDYFVIDQALEGSSLNIYNRWGTSIYHAAHYDNSWSGEEAGTGIYFYTLRNKCVDYPISGTIHLFK